MHSVWYHAMRMSSFPHSQSCHKDPTLAFVTNSQRSTGALKEEATALDEIKQVYISIYDCKSKDKLQKTPADAFPFIPTETFLNQEKMMPLKHRGP